MKIRRLFIAGLAITLGLIALIGCAGAAPPTQAPPAPTTAPAAQAPAATNVPAPTAAPAATSAPQPTAAPQNPAAARDQELAKLAEAAKAEGSLTWGDGLKPEEADPLIKAFTAKYPFIKLEHTRINDTDSRERLFRELQAGKVTFDVFDISGEEIPTFKKAGLLATVDWTKMFPVRPEMLDPDGQLLAYGSSVKVVGYNKNKVKPEDLPKTWNDLLDPKWKGKLVVDSRPKSFLQLMPAWGEQVVYDYLKKLADNQPQFRRGQSESIQLMAAGDISIIAGTYYHSMKLVMDKGAPIDVVILEPVPFSFDFEAVAKASPHPNAARLFLGWMATEGEQYYDKATARGIPLPGFNTAISALIGNKKLSIFDYNWALREGDLDKKAGQVMGLDK